MLILFLTLAMIALFDSISMVPLAVIPMTLALGGQRPLTSAGAFVGGMGFQRLAEIVTRIMPPIVALLFFLVGLIMVADGISWFLGYPLLSVGSLAKL